MFPSRGNPPVAQDNTATATVGVDRPILGAYYMLHATATMVTNSVGVPVGTPCTQADMTLQIGCLVQASPCSLGYASRQATAWNGAAGSVTAASLVNTVPDANSCIRHRQYPFWRKLYLNTLVGFPNVTGQEQQLAMCENNSTVMTQAMIDNGLVAVSPPFCEDYNEQMLCGAATNVNGCANIGNGWGGSFATTICGNGVVESFEDCDNGAAGTSTQVAGTPGNMDSGPPGSCSLTCRFN